jgi:hypothetical protein
MRISTITHGHLSCSGPAAVLLNFPIFTLSGVTAQDIHIKVIYVNSSTHSSLRALTRGHLHWSKGFHHCLTASIKVRLFAVSTEASHSFFSNFRFVSSKCWHRTKLCTRHYFAQQSVRAVVVCLTFHFLSHGGLCC